MGSVLVRRPGMEFMKDAVPGEAYKTGSLEMQKAGAPDTLGKFNPGLGPQDFALFGSAKFIPKGSDLVFNMHYTSVGKAATDRSKVGLVFAKKPPEAALLHAQRSDAVPIWRSRREQATRKSFPR